MDTKPEKSGCSLGGEGAANWGAVYKICKKAVQEKGLEINFFPKRGSNLGKIGSILNYIRIYKYCMEFNSYFDSLQAVIPETARQHPLLATLAWFGRVN
jgi:hypothetical protein